MIIKVVTEIKGIPHGFAMGIDKTDSWHTKSKTIYGGYAVYDTQYDFENVKYIKLY